MKEIHFIELPKFRLKSPDELNTKFEKWVYALKYGEVYSDDIEHIPEKLREEEIVMALREMLKAGDDDEIRELLDMREKARHDEASRLYNAKIEGKLEGKLEGEQIGLARGKLESLVNKTLKLTLRKFGTLSPELEEKIKSCNEPEKLDQIIDNIFDISSLEEISKILD